MSLHRQIMEAHKSGCRPVCSLEVEDGKTGPLLDWFAYSVLLWVQVGYW